MPKLISFVSQKKRALKARFFYLENRTYPFKILSNTPLFDKEVLKKFEKRNSSVTLFTQNDGSSFSTVLILNDDKFLLV